MNWKKEYDSKKTSAVEAVQRVRSGDRVYLGSGCAVPQELTRALVERAEELHDVEIVHLLTFGMAPYSKRQHAKSFHHNAFFIGGNVRDAVNEGRADYTPVFLSEIPALFRSGQMPLDCALVMVSPPDKNGYCSLGIHPDLGMTAVNTAKTVIAEVNRAMPRVHGDTFVHVRDIDVFIENTHELVEFVSEAPGPISSAIGRHIASLVPDGATLQLGIGKIPDAILPLLINHKDLGIHSEMIGNGVIDLMERGVITNARKPIHAGKVVSSFAMGTFELYEYLRDNPAFEFHPTEYVNDPRIIAQHPKMVSVNSAVEVDLTGQVVSDSMGHRFYSGIGGQVDFIRGAAMSDGGRPVLALPSTAAGGTRSRIVTELTPGAGVVTSRGDVHYVVTEYGVAYLHGKSVRERAMALVEIAHPDFRPELRAHAVNRKLIPSHWQVPSELDRYPDGLEKQKQFGDQQFFVRPIRSDDADRLMRFFYSHDPETVYGRYRFPKQSMPREEAVRLCTMDYKYRFALGVFRDAGKSIELVAIGRYEGDETTKVAEPAFVVHEKFRRRGMANYLYDQLRVRAAECGLTSFEGSFSIENRASIELHRARGNDVHYADGLYWYQDSLESLEPPGTLELGEASTSLST